MKKKFIIAISVILVVSWFVYITNENNLSGADVPQEVSENLAVTDESFATEPIIQAAMQATTQPPSAALTTEPPNATADCCTHD